MGIIEISMVVILSVALAYLIGNLGWEIFTSDLLKLESVLQKHGIQYKIVQGKDDTQYLQILRGVVNVTAFTFTAKGKLLIK